MRAIIILLLTLILSINLYTQDSTPTANENALMRINKFEARKNPVSFINIVLFTPYPTLLEYARINGIEIYPYDNEASLRRRIIKRQVNIDVVPAKGNDEIKTVMRNVTRSTGGSVQLQSADYAERYTIKEVDEELIFLYGNVTLKLYQNFLSADRAVYSLKTGEVFAQGNIKVKSSDNDLNGDWFLLNRDSKRGVLFNGATKFQTYRIEGDIIKFNDEKFFAENSSVSFSRLTPVAHDFLTSRVYLWDSKKILTVNSIYRVGIQPVFYFPIFLQNYVGTGIISTFGQTLREGVYIQNSKTFDFYGMTHRLRFDAYQKLGFLIGDEIRYTSKDHNLSLDAMFALGRQYYLLDSYISSSLGYGTRYVNYFVDGQVGKYVPRYKIQYDHTVQLYDSENIRSSISGRLNLNSDLYFKSDFYNQRQNLDILSLFTSLTGNLDDIGNSTPESYIENSFYINNYIYGFNLRVGAQWDLASVRNTSVDKNTNFDYYMPKPSRLILPSVQASYSSVIGNDVSYYFQDWYVNYSLGLDYSHTINYKTSEGIDFYNNPKLDEQLQEKLAERDNLKTSASLNKSFTNSFINFTPYALLDYSYQKSINPKAEDLIYDKDNTYVGLGTRSTFSMFLPDSVVPYSWDNYFTPSIRWDNTYSLGYRFKEVSVDKNTNANGSGEFANHDINTRFSIGGTGYGLFFLKNLDLTLEGYITAGYDLKPTYNIENRMYEINFSTNRFLTTEVGSTSRLSFYESYLSYDISKNLIGTNFTRNILNTLIRVPIPLDDLTDWILIEHGMRPFFENSAGINDFRLFFDLSYKHDFINYKYNNIGFTFGLDLKILDQWRFRFSTTSANNRAYRYIKSYAEKENETWVNPFEDIANSFAYSDSQKRIDSLFKLSSIQTSIWHELDGWQMEISFAVKPSTLPSDIASGSVKGAYWSKEFWVEFTLTDFNGVGLPKREYDLNTTITDLKNNNNN